MVHFIWPVMTEKLFSLPLTKVDIHFGHVRMNAMPYPISSLLIVAYLYLFEVLMLSVAGFIENL